MKKLLILVAVLFCVSMPLSASAYTISDLYGTWTGVWNVTLEGDANGNTWTSGNGIGPHNVILTLNALNSGSFGYYDVQTANWYDGSVVSLSYAGNLITASIDYTALGVPAGVQWQPILSASLSNIGSVLSMNGTYNEPLPAPGGSWMDRGTISFNRSTPYNAVPEPVTMLLVGLGLVGLAGAQRKFKK